MGIVNRIAQWFAGKPGRDPAALPPVKSRPVETYRGFRRNAVYGRMAAGNTPLDLRRAIRGVSAALASQRNIMTHRQRADLVEQVKAARTA